MHSILCLNSHATKFSIAGTNAKRDDRLPATMHLHRLQRKFARNQRPSTINLPEILTAHRTATNWNARAIKINHKFLSRKSVVTHRPTNFETSSTVEIELHRIIEVKPRNCKREIRQRNQERVACRPIRINSTPLQSVMQRNRQRIKTPRSRIRIFSKKHNHLSIWPTIRSVCFRECVKRLCEVSRQRMFDRQISSPRRAARISSDDRLIIRHRTNLGLACRKLSSNEIGDHIQLVIFRPRPICIPRTSVNALGDCSHIHFVSAVTCDSAINEN